ncbi:TPA: autotransporter outer membrane beta-barrel domain-containing protein, partial [Escherichia coli]|nr:autotransporter outer membrane beta-barrel domain-containing protein [Escherichia coli]
GAYNQNTVNSLKNAYTQNIALNDGKFVYNNGDSYTLNDKAGTIEKTTSKKQNKDLSFSGGGTLNLTNNMDLGVGGLIFDTGHHYTINGDGKSFKGAGVDIGASSVVDWNIKGVSGDNLHKIGAGTLNVNTAQGNNLKTGDGTVVLNSEKAFNNIYIASGRGTVKINHDGALNSDNDYRGVFFTEKGGTLDLNGYNQDFVKIAATDSGALITNSSDKASTLSVNNKSNYIYHGSVSGNTSISHSFDQKTANSRLILDGNVSVNDINIKNSQLTMQGHATTHAIFHEGALKCQIPGVPMFCDKDYAGYIQSQEKDANKKNNSDYKSNNQVASFDQPDWDSRTFVFRNMNLQNADFSQGRNSAITGDITASASTLTLGDASVYIDMYDGSNITGDGFGFRQNVSAGTSSAPLSSSYDGFITLTDNSVLNIGNKFNGGVDAQDSTVNITSTDAVFSQAGSFVNSALTLKEGAHASFENGLFSAGKTVTLEKGASLNLTGIPGENHGHAPVISQTDGFTLHGNASLTSADQSILYGDITGDGASSITLGNKDASDTTASSVLSSLLQGYNTAYSGAVTAGSGSVTMNNALWNVTGNSTTGALTASGSKVSISPDSGFSTLSIGSLNASNTDFVLRTDLTHADKIAVTQSASGQNNRVLVNFLKTPANGTLNIPLISAPEGTSKDVFTAGTQVEGFSQVTPVLSTTDTDGKTQWNLTGFKTAPDKATTSKAASLTSGGYKNFMTEVNNMNKRMGELRDTHGDAGAWARIMSGTGSADGGYSDNYTHVQVGFDKKHELDGLDLFTGVTMTYTDSNA